MSITAYRERVFYNDKDQEISDNLPYGAIWKSAVEVIQAANFLGPVESNNGFTVLGVPLTGGGGGSQHEIQDEGVALTARSALNFVGDYVGASDDSGNDATVITVNPTADSVLNTILADMANFTLKGRHTAGTGDPEDLTATQVREILDVEEGANDYTHPNHSGDVTSVGDGATTIANSAVTNAKLADMAQSTLKGRAKGAGTGTATDLSVRQSREVLRGATSEASNATPSINVDNVAYHEITALAADITSVTITGTPDNGTTLWLSITGTAERAITLGSDFEASTIALPTTTDGTNRLDLGFVWNSATSKMRLVAKA